MRKKVDNEKKSSKERIKQWSSKSKVSEASIRVLSGPSCFLQETLHSSETPMQDDYRLLALIGIA